jgi:hypothetical protein
VIKLIKNVYANNFNKNVPIFGISKTNLRDFTTTERDFNKGFSRHPPIIFRIWDEDIIEDQSRKVLEKEEAADSDINEIDINAQIAQNHQAKYGQKQPNEDDSDEEGAEDPTATRT